MADLKITELQALAGANLAATDELAVADISASETKKITVSDLIAFGADLIANAEIPSAKISFAAGSIVEASLDTGAVTAAKIGSDAVTATKLADQSTCIVAANLAALQAVTGDFVGQLGFTTDNVKIYLWQNSTWNAAKAAGSINTISADTSGIVNITVSTSGDTATVGTSLDNTAAAAQFLAGPTGSAGAVGYRAIVGTDLPVPTTTTKGAIAVNGEGLRMDGDRLEIDNDVTLSATHHLVTYDAKGLINGGRAIISTDLPAATSGAIGAVTPGTGLSVNGAGALNHTNVVTPGTYAKITFDAQGHVVAGTALADTDLPNHSAALLTSGTLNADRIASNAVTAAKLADYATTTIGNAPPAAEHIGQFFFNPLERTLFLWDGNVYQPVGISAGEIVFSGTYDASVNQVDSVTTDGAAIGLVAGQALPAAGASNRSYYVVVSQTGTGTTPAPAVTLEPPDILLSNGTNWVLLEVSETVTAQLASNVQFSPTGDIVSTNVQSAIAEVDSEKLPKAGGTMTGNLELGQNVVLVFEGSTADGNETTLTVANPTADRTITLPNVSGTVVTTGDTGTVTSTMIADGTIVDADISGSAEIAVSKLADGAARQLLQTDAAGTGVEWASNIDIPGTLDVTSAATFDSSVAVTGALTKSGNNVVTVGDTGTVTSSMIADGTIVNADVNAGAAIDGTKISPNFGSQTITTTGVVSAALGAAATPSITFTGDLNTGIYSPGADQVAVATNGVGRLFVSSSGRLGIGTSSATARMTIGDGNVYFTNSSSSASTVREVFNYINPSASVASSNGLSVGFRQSDIFPNRGASVRFIQTGNSDGGGDASTAIGFWTYNLGYDNGVERMRLTSTGLGIGTTSPSQALHVVGTVQAASTSSTASSNVGLRLSNSGDGTLFNGISFQGNYFSDLYFGRSGGADDLVVRNGSSELLRIQNGGRLLVGTSTSTSTANVGANQNIQVQGSSSLANVSVIGNAASSIGGYLTLAKSRSTAAGGFTVVTQGDELGAISFEGADGSAYRVGASIGCVVDGTPGSNDMPGRLVFSTTADGASSPTERMRITNGGTIMVNTTSNDPVGTSVSQSLACGPGASDGAFNYYNASAQCLKIGRGNNGDIITFFRNQPSATVVGSVSVTTTATAYNTSSDYRLKENVVAVTDGIARLQQLKPSRFNFIADPSKTVDGFLAHEAAEVVPECVTGEKDAVDDDGNPIYQGIDQSKLVPLLTAALQEAIGEIKSLKARVVALESA